MASFPLVSVIVPTHKRAVLLARALRSIRSQTQDIPLEIIVVSDVIDPPTDTVCSTELTPSDTYVRRSGAAGPSASRNLALSLARGAYILFLDDDDAWHPDCLAQLLEQEPVQQHLPVYFNCSVVHERRLPQGPQFISEVDVNFRACLTKDSYVRNQIHMSCIAIPRNILSGIEFDTCMRAYEDWEFMLAIYDRVSLIHVPIRGSQIFQVPDDTTDRRGDSTKAKDVNAIGDYLYVYHRHPAPDPEIVQKRALFLQNLRIAIPPQLL
jgi:GalNAc5-diNAcBac-PP-undecaprenol beta-1,3-glucosyltransferase